MTESDGTGDDGRADNHIAEDWLHPDQEALRLRRSASDDWRRRGGGEGDQAAGPLARAGVCGGGGADCQWRHRDRQSGANRAERTEAKSEWYQRPTPDLDTSQKNIAQI